MRLQGLYPVSNSPLLSNVDRYVQLRAQVLEGVGRGELDRRVVPRSRVFEPRDEMPGRLGGFSRCYGCASPMARALVVDRLLNRTIDLSDEDRVALLGIAFVESGFNPDAANPTSSASGLFQFIDRTGAAYGLHADLRWDVDAQIEAARALLADNASFAAAKLRARAPNQRIALLYALHHDGPSLQSGGEAIAKRSLVPRLPLLRSLVRAHRDLYQESEASM